MLQPFAVLTWNWLWPPPHEFCSQWDKGTRAGGLLVLLFISFREGGCLSPLEPPDSFVHAVQNVIVVSYMDDRRKKGVASWMNTSKQDFGNNFWPLHTSNLRLRAWQSILVVENCLTSGLVLFALIGVPPGDRWRVLFLNVKAGKPGFDLQNP